MSSQSALDLKAVKNKLEVLFQRYPAGNHCDICARKVGEELQKAKFDVEIVTIQNEEMPEQPGKRPSYIQGKKPDGEYFLLAKTGFHQANRVHFEDNFYYIDALVYVHYGVEAVDETTYFALFVYPDGIEITNVQAVL